MAVCYASLVKWRCFILTISCLYSCFVYCQSLINYFTSQISFYTKYWYCHIPKGYWDFGKSCNNSRNKPRFHVCWMLTAMNPLYTVKLTLYDRLPGGHVSKQDADRRGHVISHGMGHKQVDIIWHWKGMGMPFYYFPMGCGQWVGSDQASCQWLGTPRPCSVMF